MSTGAPKKLSQLEKLLSPTGDDSLYVVDNPTGTGTRPAARQLTLNDLFKNVASNTAINGTFETKKSVKFTGNGFVITTKLTPVNSVGSGISVGKFFYDSNNLYVKTDANVVKKLAFQNFTNNPNVTLVKTQTKFESFDATEEDSGCTFLLNSPSDAHVNLPYQASVGTQYIFKQINAGKYTFQSKSGGSGSVVLYGDANPKTGGLYATVTALCIENNDGNSAKWQLNGDLEILTAIPLTQRTVTVTANSTLLVSSNPSRRYLMLMVTDVKKVNLGFGSAAVSGSGMTLEGATDVGGQGATAVWENGTTPSEEIYAITDSGTTTVVVVEG